MRKTKQLISWDEETKTVGVIGACTEDEAEERLAQYTKERAQALFDVSEEEAARIKSAEAEELITDAEACSLFGVSKQTLWRWRNRGYLEGIYVGGRIKYRKADCRQILNKKDK